MTLHASFPLLLEIQDIDLERERQRRLAAEQARKLAALAAAAEKRAALHHAQHEQFRTLERDRRRLEAEDATLAQQEKRLTAQMAAIATTREAKALEDELASLAARRDVIADEILALLEQEENRAARMPTEDSVYAKFREENDTEQTRLQALAAESADLLHTLTLDRDRLLTQLPDEERDTYVWLLKQAGLPVIVPVEHDACAGCGASLNANQVIHVRLGQQLERCPQCSRFLYLR